MSVLVKSGIQLMYNTREQ